MEQTKWGFLREKEQDVLKAQENSTATFTPLSEYLKVIFPKVLDWEHNKRFSFFEGEKKRYYEADYISECLKLVIEFDGVLGHYTDPKKILRDSEKAKFFRSKGYEFVNIPYFIQLTNEVVETMFGVHVDASLFDPKIPSFVEGNTPAYLCPLGIKRMAQEFKKYPQQYNVNIQALKDMNDPLLSGIEYLEQEYNKL